jgi:hypothetical protein
VGAAVGSTAVGASVSGGAVGAGGSAVGTFDVGGTGVEVGAGARHAALKIKIPRIANASSDWGAKNFFTVPPWSLRLPVTVDRAFSLTDTL